jgi:hypothetical protein
VSGQRRQHEGILAENRRANWRVCRSSF